MSKAEEIHCKAVMAADNQELPKDYVISAHADHFNGFVEGYVEGYSQADKDLELSWEDMLKIDEIISEVYKDSNSCNTENIYQEVLKRFKDLKHVK
jgi:hypothetical protein